MVSAPLSTRVIAENPPSFTVWSLQISPDSVPWIREIKYFDKLPLLPFSSVGLATFPAAL